MNKSEKIKPFIPKKYLLLISGLLWLIIGIMLNLLSYRWLSEYTGKNTILYALSGVLIALIIHHFGFLRIVDKNLGRIKKLEPRSCMFAFMSWRSYLLIMVMISMGIVLRHSALPKNFLAILYIGIGLALILSSIRYLRIFFSFFRDTK